ncbi:CSS-motif domain-containing protein [Marinobacter antarcticus]|uniref:CSS-motif domain-containing protein n=1 Tax=Marinobacter antarcticus TaxID=564117 RepID=UPI0009328562|nr:CSS-motif domain-containing protein [Marinobacter antarcticus]
MASMQPLATSKSCSVIDRMNALGFTECSAEVLAAMRRELFLASRVRDVGFVLDNTLLYTTGLFANLIGFSVHLSQNAPLDRARPGV